MLPQVRRRCAVGVLCIAVGAFAGLMSLPAAFLGIGTPPPDSRPSSRSTSLETAKLRQLKEALMHELREVNRNLAAALEHENKVEEDEEEEEEEYDPELIRLRNRYNIKEFEARPSTRPARNSADRYETPALREGRGLVATAAILRTAAGEVEWKCDEDCLNALASDNALSPSQMREMDRKLNDDMNKVKQRLRELEYSNRLQFSAENRLRIERLEKFLEVIPNLRTKVTA